MKLFLSVLLTAAAMATTSAAQQPSVTAAALAAQQPAAATPAAPAVPSDARLKLRDAQFRAGAIFGEMLQTAEYRAFIRTPQYQAYEAALAAVRDAIAEAAKSGGCEVDPQTAQCRALAPAPPVTPASK
jgi:hypothetical protein